jgi:UPF0716 protein FxsA
MPKPGSDKKRPGSDKKRPRWRWYQPGTDYIVLCAPEAPLLEAHGRPGRVKKATTRRRLGPGYVGSAKKRRDLSAMSFTVAEPAGLSAEPPGATRSRFWPAAGDQRHDRAKRAAKRRLGAVIFVLVLIGVPAVEVFVFIEVGLAIGWLLATVLLLGTSLVGVPLLRIEGRSAIKRVSQAVSERRPTGGIAIDGALGFIGCILLVIPGFVTDALGVVLLLPLTRGLARRSISRQYARRVTSFAATAARFTSRDRRTWPPHVESTAVDDDRDELGA